MKLTTPEKNDIASTLQMDSHSKPGRKKRWLWGILVLIALIVFFAAWSKNGKASAIEYKTQAVVRGDLTVVVSPTGTLEPTNEVEVGSELSGIIKEIYVDFNDQVKVGQPLARLDVSKLQAQVTQTKASLESAKAQVLQAQATIEETYNKLQQLEKVRQLSDGKVPSQTEMDEAKAAYSRAKANEASALAAVAEVQAGLDINETDLSKALISSPINGIVLTRKIEVGQTVAASFEAPVLFTLAEDLTQMELHVAVDEADIGQVKEGQSATFTVDAYLDHSYAAQVSQVRYGSSTVDGVVTYETVLTVDNSDLSLRPGMTASAEIVVKKIENAVLVPSAALRFTPPVSEEKKSSGSIINSILPHPPQEEKRQNVSLNNHGQQQVWILKDGQPVAVSVQVGVTNDIQTEILSGELAPETLVITDTITTGK
ncbi:MAG: efflux RND transporter periplasmic adaptor subunit [Sedimentisphaerales bacterium]|nr:efflux RND transporter periplasmic adaptor subunit [Sedimentisphaerales bacterium]